MIEFLKSAVWFLEGLWRRMLDVLGQSHRLLRVTVSCATLVFTFGLLSGPQSSHGHPVVRDWRGDLRMACSYPFKTQQLQEVA